MAARYSLEKLRLRVSSQFEPRSPALPRMVVRELRWMPRARRFAFSTSAWVTPSALTLLDDSGDGILRGLAVGGVEVGIDAEEAGVARGVAVGGDGVDQAELLAELLVEAGAGAIPEDGREEIEGGDVRAGDAMGCARRY